MRYLKLVLLLVTMAQLPSALSATSPSLDTENGQFTLHNVFKNGLLYTADFTATDMDGNWREWTFRISTYGFIRYTFKREQTNPLFNHATGELHIPEVVVNGEAYSIVMQIIDWRKTFKPNWEDWEWQIIQTRTIQDPCQGKSDPDVAGCDCRTRVQSLLPNLTGPFCAGTTKMPLLDSSRKETLSPESDPGSRELMLHIWYPTDTTTRGEFAEYMDSKSLDWMINAFYLGKIFDLPTDANNNIRPHGLVNAPIATAQKNYPVLLFSPGLFYISSSYTAFFEMLASHGYIVVAINHPYISGLTVFPDGHMIKPPPSSLEIGQMIDENFSVLIDDTSFVLDHLENIASTNPTSPISQYLDLTRLGMFGHSLGGALALQMCQDQRVDACINIDGVPRGDVVQMGMGKPIFLLRSVMVTNDNLFNDFWNVVTGDAYSVRIIGTGHNAYSDVGIMLNFFLPTLSPTTLGLGVLKAQRTIEIVNSLQVDFFNAYVKNEGANEFNISAQEYPEAIIRRK